MPEGKRTGSLKTRYGLAPRRRYADVTTIVKARYPCQRCGYTRVRRVSVGVWRCSKCGYTFAGGAYQPTTKVGEAAQRVSSPAKAAIPSVTQARTPGA
ncbi:MAG: 50S ribosomal protein L37ae [Candidatus Bathyarchaeia archaeon]